MDIELLKINDSENIDILKCYVESISTSNILDELPQILWRNDGASIVQTLLNGLGNSRSCLEKKIQITETIIFEIERKHLPARIAEKLVNVLAGEVDSFSTSQLLRLVDVCSEMIKNPNLGSNFSCWKELLPKLLHLIVVKPSVDHNGSEMTGEQFKSNVITLLSMTDWSGSIIVDLAAMFIDMPMSKDERSRIVKKLCCQLSSLKPEEIPPLSHQLLQLTKSEHSVVFFLALAGYFNANLYKDINNTAARAIKEISDVEGTVLYHIVNNLGPACFKGLLKSLKLCLNSPQFALQPFFVTLLLALSSVSATYEDDVISLLRAAFARALQEGERMMESSWYRTVCPAALDVNGVISCVLENCFRGREMVLKGLVNLGFSFLAAGKASDGLHSLGTTILEDMLRRNRLVSSVVLETLANHISQASDSLQYTDCLVVLARKQPMSVLECTGPLLQLLESCTRLPARTGNQVLTALLPLARLSHTIRDNLVIVLRKSIFSQDVDRRMMSVRGFLELLKDLKISNLQNLSQSMSQNYCNFTQLCSQSLAGSASPSNEGLCLEVLSILRVVFKHQQQVKVELYKGVYSAVRSNPELGPHTLDYLQTHLTRWLSQDVLPPLRFEDCATVHGEEVVLIEPLGHLILSLALLAAKLEDSNRSERLQEKLLSLSEQMACCNHTHFQTDLTSLSEPSPQGLKTMEMLRQALGVFEALMGFLLSSWNKGSADKPAIFLSLFKSYTCLCDFARGLGKSDKKRSDKKTKEKKKPIVFKFPDTVLNLKCCARLLVVTNNMPAPWAPEETTMQLCGKRELHRYTMQTAAQVVRDARALTPTELSRDCHSLGYICNIGRTLYTKCVSRLAESIAFDLPAAATGLQVFSDVLTLILSHFKSKLNNFLGEIAGEPVESQKNCLKTVLNTLLDQLGDVLFDDGQEEEVKEDLQSKKVPVLYMAIISSLVQQLPSGTPFILQVYEKIKEVCREKKIEKPGDCKALLTLLLRLHRRCKESSPLLLDLALCLCDSMELIDDEMEVEEHVEYKIVNSRTANVCLVALCDALLLQMADIDWTLNRLKSEVTTLPFPTDEPTEDRHDELRRREVELCRHVDECVKVLSTLCTIAVPPGVYSDSVLKNLEVIYIRLTALTKYFIVKVTKFQDNLPATKFDKTVRLVDAELTKNMYCFTEHVITDGTTDSNGVNPNLLKQRAMKETKLIPRVVLEKEQYHKFLLQLSKRAKLDLAAKTKHAMARDYRLYTRQVKELIDNERNEMEEEEMEIEETEEATESLPLSDSPITKRRRTAVIVEESSQDSP